MQKIQVSEIVTARLTVSGHATSRNVTRDYVHVM